MAENEEGGYGLLTRNPLEELERATGFEPATSSLGSWHSATELRPPCPFYITRSRLLGLGGSYVPSLSDMSNALMSSSLRAFQFRRLETP